MTNTAQKGILLPIRLQGSEYLIDEISAIIRSRKYGKGVIIDALTSFIAGLCTEDNNYPEHEIKATVIKELEEKIKLLKLGKVAHHETN